VSGQSFSVFDIDSSSFPTMKARFFAFDSKGKQLITLSPSDFLVKENGIERTVTNITCPPEKPEVPLSSVLTVDVSGSMQGDGINLAKAGGRAWVNSMNFNTSECAITTFDTKNYFIQDFSSDKTKLLSAMNNLNSGGGTDYNAALIEPTAGSLIALHNGRYKKVVIFISDGGANFPPNTAEIVKQANDEGASIYCIIVFNDAPQYVKDMCLQTGGLYFDNMKNESQIVAAYMTIYLRSVNSDACSIEWQSKYSCQPDINATIQENSLNLISAFQYSLAYNQVARLEIVPSGIQMGFVPKGSFKDTTINISAYYGDFNITNITSSNTNFTVNPTTLSIQAGSTKTVNIRYTSIQDSVFDFASFKIENDICKPYTLFARTSSKQNANNKTLKVVFPNGGEKLVAGADSIITWDGVLPSDTVVLEYSINNGNSWQTLTTGTTNLKYIWKNIPKPTSNQCLIKASLKSSDYSGDSVGSVKFLKGHSNVITSVAFSPDSSKIASGSFDQTIKIWDVNSGVVFRTLSGHKNYVYSVAFSADGSKIVSGSADSTIKLWDINTGAVLKNFKGHTGQVSSTVFINDGSTIASGSYDSTVKIWNANTGAVIRTLSGFNGYVNAIAVSADGTKIAAASVDKTIKLWEVNSGTLICTFLGHSAGVNTIAFSTDGKKLVSGSDDNLVKIWNTSSGTLIRTLSGHGNFVNSVAFNLSGTEILSGSSDKTIKLWDVNSNSSIRTYKGHSSIVTSVAFSPNGMKIISGSWDNSIKLWNTNTAEELRSFTGHTNYINSLKFSPDGSKIASGGNDKNIILWDAVKGSSLKLFTGNSGNVNAIDYSPDGTKVVSGNDDNTVNLWDIYTGSIVHTFSGHNAKINAVAFSYDGSMIASGSFDNTIKLWNVNTGILINTFTGSSTGITSVVFCPDNSMIAYSNENDIIRLIDIKSGSLIRELTGHTDRVTSVSFNHDGTKLLSGSYDKTLILWDVKSGSSIRTFSGNTDYVKSVAFSPDELTIASGGQDKTVKIWNINNGNLVRSFNGHTNWVNTISFSPDGSRLASGSNDLSVGIWNIENIPIIIDTDTSDAVFSIVEPIAAAHDIDMGKVNAGTPKDTVIAGFLNNTGSYKIRIDSIKFNNNNNIFRLVGIIPPYSIDAGKTKDAEFEFNPTGGGIFSDSIFIYNQGKLLKYKITGQGIQPALKIVNSLINFGKVYTGRTKDTLAVATIQNMGSSSLKITNTIQGPPNVIDFSILSGGGSFTLLPGETKLMNLRFKPSDAGRTSGSLQFEYNDIGSPAYIQLYGQGFNTSPKITTNSPVCQGDDILLYSDVVPDVNCTWFGPNGFTSTGKNVIIKQADTLKSGKYYFYETIEGINSDTVSLNIEVNTKLISPGDSSLLFVGSANKIDNYIKLTNAVPWDGGSIWLKKRFSIKQDFATTFQFRTRFGDNAGHDDGSLPGADGLAFVMQNNKYPRLGDRGGSMGYTGIINSLAVEFDLFQNAWDPNGNHVAVQSLGDLPNTADHRNKKSVLGINDSIILIQRDTLYYAKIEYFWSTKTLNIYLDSTDNLLKPVLVVNNLDLVTFLNLEDGEYLYIGFTAGTGDAFQEHDLLNWTIPCKNQFVDVGELPVQTNNYNLIVYPNPANEHIKIFLDNTMNEPGQNSFCNNQIYLTNLLGEKVLSVVSGNDFYTGNRTLTIDTKDLTTGTYFINFLTPSRVETRIIQIVK